MKKVIVILSILLVGQFTLAQEAIDYNEILTTTTMPSDAEIRMIVNKFNFSQEEKEQLFQETKRQLQELYASQNAQLLEQKAIQGTQMLKGTGLTVQDFMLPEAR